MKRLSTLIVFEAALLAAALLAPGTSRASPSEDACAGPASPAREAGCAIKKAAADFASLQAQVQAKLDPVRGAVSAALSLEVSSPGAAGFDGYMAGLKSTEDAFLRPHDAGGLAAAHSKWQANYQAVRTALGAQRDLLQPIPIELDKPLAGFGPLRETLAQVGKDLGASGDGLEALRSERDGLESKVRAYEKGLQGSVRPAVEQAAAAAVDLVFWLDSSNVGLQARVAAGVYSEDWEDLDARKEQVDRAEGNDARDLRDRFASDFAQLKRSRDVLNGDEWGE